MASSWCSTRPGSRASTCSRPAPNSARARRNVPRSNRRGRSTCSIFWQLAEIVSLKSQKIEHVERPRRFDRGTFRLARAEFGAGLEHVEARLPGLVEHHELAIEDHALVRNRLHGPRDLRKRLRVLKALARVENRLAILAPRAHPVAVQLHLEEPALFCKWLLARLRQH